MSDTPICASVERDLHLSVDELTAPRAAPAEPSGPPADAEQAPR